MLVEHTRRKKLNAKGLALLPPGAGWLYVEFGAETTAERHHAFVDRFGHRVLFGIGVSHAVLINSREPDTYRRPVATTRAYLDALDAAADPLPPGDRVLAALGPKMLDLARTRAGGTHPYLVTPVHTATARAALGPERLVAPEQAVVLETDPVRARELARTHLAGYIGLPNYSNNWLRAGFDEDDTLPFVSAIRKAS